jgi:hypothetical protein
MVTTRFNLLEGYRAYFDKEGDDEPAVSGLAVEVDTKKATDGGRTSALFERSYYSAETIVCICHLK